MALYNQYERKEYEIPGWEKFATAQVVKVVSPDMDGSFIAYFELTEEQANIVIDKEVAFFTRLGKSFEWKTYDSDQPENIGVMLLQKGFVAEEPESFMALDLASCELPEPQMLCAEVTDEEGIRDAMRVKQELRGEACQAQLLHLIETKRQDPASIRIYVVYQDGKPVSSAWITFNADSPFAGIWGGSTLPEYRGAAVIRHCSNNGFGTPSWLGNNT